MIYLASPYSSKEPGVVQHRVEVTKRVTADLLLRGLMVFSPIVHCHELCAIHDMPTDAGYWLRYNTNILRRCDELYVLTMPGWQSSIGVQQEMSLAVTLGLPTTFVNERGLTYTENSF